MTTIGSTAYYPSTSYYSSSEKSTFKVDDAATPSPQPQTSDKISNKAYSYSNATDTLVSSQSYAASANFQEKLLYIQAKLTTQDLSKSGTAASLPQSTPVWEMPEDFYQSFVDARQSILESEYRQMPEPQDLSNYPGIKPYAEVVIGGQVVAKIDNQGVVSTDDDRLGEKLKGLSEQATGKSGPELAQTLADQIAKLVGGRVVKSDTALSQAQFDALPKLEEPQPRIDYDAMRADPEYHQIQDLKQKRESYLGSLQV